AGDFVDKTLALMFGVFLQFGLMVAAVMAGKQLGTVGAQKILGSAQTAAKKGAYWGSGAGVAVAGGRLAGKGVSAGAKYVGRQTKYQAQDYLRGVTSPIIAAARRGQYGKSAKFLAGVERDKEGKPKKGQQALLEEAGKKHAKKFVKEDPRAVARTQAARNVIAGQGNKVNEKNVHDRALAPSVLQSDQGKEMLGDNVVERAKRAINIMKHGSMGQVGAIIKDEKFLRDIKQDPKGQQIFIKMQQVLEDKTSFIDHTGSKQKVDKNVVGRAIDTLQDKIQKIETGE
ncbi:MAG: hypothetical protein ACRD4B_02270, partial [Acidobacteriota bacterium]